MNPRVDCFSQNRTNGLMEYECPDCGVMRHLTRARWDEVQDVDKPLRCLACGAVYQLPARNSK